MIIAISNIFQNFIVLQVPVVAEPPTPAAEVAPVQTAVAPEPVAAPVAAVEPQAAQENASPAAPEAAVSAAPEVGCTQYLNQDGNTSVSDVLSLYQTSI